MISGLRLLRNNVKRTSVGKINKRLLRERFCLRRLRACTSEAT